MQRLRALLANDASLAGHHGSALVTSQIVRLAGEAGIDVEHGWDWDAVEAEIARGPRFDLVIVNGEGSIHHDSGTARRIARLAGELRAREVPAYLINTSEESNGPQVLEGLAAFRLRYVRDRASQASLARTGLHALVVPDLTLSWSAAPIAHKQGAIVVTDASDKRKAQRLLAFARGKPNARMLSFRCEPPLPVRGSGRRRTGFQMKRAMARFAPASAWSIRYAGTISSRDALMELLTQRTRGLIAGRYHGVCYALRIGLPFIAIGGNTGKVGALLSDIGVPKRLVALEALEADGSAIGIDDFSAGESAAISAFLKRAEVEARQMFSAIAADARA